MILHNAKVRHDGERRPAGPIRSALWGPADYRGGPPGWLVSEGLTVGLIGVAAVVGPGVAGVLTGSAALRTGEPGVVVTLGLALYLFITGAGRALIGAVAVTGMFLAVLTPRATAEAVLARGGVVRQVVVTSVAVQHDNGRGRRYCAVRHSDGTPVSVRIWRGCEETTGPGDHISMVYDPKGRVPPRGLAASGAHTQPYAEPAGAGLALVTLCVVAVVRSYRLTPHHSHGK